MIAHLLRISFSVQLLLLEYVHGLGKYSLSVGDQERFPHGLGSLENCASETFCVIQHPKIKSIFKRSDIHDCKHLH